MRFTVVTFQSKKPQWISLIEEEYTEKLRRFVQLEFVQIQSKTGTRESKEARRLFETDQIEKLLARPGFHVLFDERGKNQSSIQFSGLLARAQVDGFSNFYFYIGGPFGFEVSHLAKAHLVLSLSPFVLNHLVAFTVVLEQLYRSVSIQNNLPYHNE